MTAQVRVSQLRIGVIQPRLDGQGGAEKYGAYCIQMLRERFGPDRVDVISEHEVDPARIEAAFDLRLDGVRFLHEPECNPVPSSAGGVRGRLERAAQLRGYEALTRRYDLLLANTIALPLRSAARRSTVICHFPVVRGERVDATIPHRGLASLASSSSRTQREIRSRLDSWSNLITSSRFAQGWIRRYWDREALVLNPPVSTPNPADLLPADQRKRWIVGIGFFERPTGLDGTTWSYKRQELMIETFKGLCERGLAGWELHLAGHVLPPTPDTWSYVEDLRRSLEGYPVHVHPSCPFSELRDLFRQSSLFWHAAGYGLDEESSPERMEHFGMVTVEAMSWGLVPVVINRGGQPEIVEPGRSGLLWSTLDEWREQTLRLCADDAERIRLSSAARARADHFSLDRFRREFLTFVEGELTDLGLPRASTQAHGRSPA